MRHDVLLELRKTLYHLFLPSPCLSCGRVDRDLERPFGLCRACVGRLIEIETPACPTCARPLAAAAVPDGFRCGRCRLRSPALSGLTACWHYRPPLDEVILALKFTRLRFLGEQLGRVLAERLALDPPPVDQVVPVPLHWLRGLSRGYNQADEIARQVARGLDLPRVRALRRRRATRPQMELPRAERRGNLQDAFVCRSPKRVANRAVLLVDDVTTTGATLDEAAKCLRRAGSGPIFAAVVARTPEPGETRIGGKVIRKVSLTQRKNRRILAIRRTSPTKPR